jgi:hypothetical protein
MTDLPSSSKTDAPAPTAQSAETAVIGAAATGDQSGDTSIRPFKFQASDEELADLRRRIKATKWPERENDPTQGVNLATIQKLADYWLNHPDWRKIEARINSYPNFVHGGRDSRRDRQGHSRWARAGRPLAGRKVRLG